MPKFYVSAPRTVYARISCSKWFSFCFYVVAALVLQGIVHRRREQTGEIGDQDHHGNREVYRARRTRGGDRAGQSRARRRLRRRTRGVPGPADGHPYGGSGEVAVRHCHGQGGHH